MRYSSAWVDFWREHWCPGEPVWCGSRKLFPDWRSWCCTRPPSGPAVSWPPPPAWLVTAWRSCLSASDRLPLCYLLCLTIFHQSKLHILHKYNNWCSVSIKPLSHLTRLILRTWNGYEFLLSVDVRQYSFYVRSMFGTFVSCPVMCSLSVTIRWKVFCMHKNWNGWWRTRIFIGCPVHVRFVLYISCFCSQFIP